MGDAGEGLIDADARIQERIDELEEAKKKKGQVLHGDPERLREKESLRLARTELERQLGATTHDVRKKQLKSAIAELDTRLDALKDPPPRKK
jgi:hypothetical protein